MQKQTDIIIPVFNRWEHTKQTLDSLIKNTNPALYKLYVVDDCSDPDVGEALRHYQMQAPISINFSLFTQMENIGPAASRNATCLYITRENKRSDYLYHSDNDVFFTPLWLEILTKALEVAGHKDIKLLGGGCHPYLQNNDRISHPLAPHIGIGIKDAVSGYSQLMTWETWDKYGPFDEGNRTQEIKIMGSEDWAFCQRIIKDGFKVGSIEPEVVIATGKTNTYGSPATGSETFKNIEGVMIK